MPIYEYCCLQCDARFEALQKIGADGSDLNCPNCNAKKPEKILSLFASSGNTSSGTSSAGCASGSGFT